MDYSHAFQLWKIEPPSWLAQLLAIPDDQDLCLGDIRFALPVPFLTPQEVANAHALLADWEIVGKLIPLAGDFHDLLCLDAATAGADIVLLNDARQELARFDGYDDLRRCLRTAQPAPNTDGMIISAWFDF